MSGTALTVLPAQSATGGGLTATVDAGASRIHYDGYLPSGVLDLAPSIRFDAPAAVLVARGSVARFESGNLNSQGAVAGSAFTPGRGALRGELAVGASLGYHQSIGNTGIAQIGGRLHAVRSNAGAWAGVGYGWSALGGGLGAGASTREVGGWLRRRTGWGGSLRASAVYRATGVADVDYTEGSVALRWTGARLELGADGGARRGERALGSGHERSWLSADAAFWLRPRLAVVGAAGSFLSDPTTSAIGGSYASLGLRLALRRPAPDELPRVILPRSVGRPDAASGAAASGAAASGAAASGAAASGAAAAGAGAPGTESMLVEESGDGRVTLRFTLPGASSAQLMGDFTDWAPLPLERDPAGRWSVTVALAPGVHRVNLRTGDGPWRAPPGLTAVDDGFGGQVGLLVVSR